MKRDAQALRVSLGELDRRLLRGRRATVATETEASPGANARCSFSKGCMANLAVIGATCGHGELARLDRLCHASLIDAALPCRARLVRFAHAEPAAAHRALCASTATAALIAQEELLQAGFWCVAIQPPTVAPGRARLLP
jgi:7-keto-8-aminopelargonate synthetase-like enzyme